MPRPALAVIAVIIALTSITACSGGNPPDRSRPPVPPTGGHRAGSPPGSHPSRTLIPAVTPTCRPGVNAAEFWMISHRELAVMSAVAPDEVKYAVKPANLFVPGAADTPSRVGQTVADFKSYSALVTAIASHRIPRTVHWLMYDNEQWRPTPVDEQHNPGYYESQFAALAHRHGYRVILAPGQDLALGFGKSRLPAGKPAWRRYLAMHLPAESARAGDIYEIQSQAYELPGFRKQNLFLNVIKAAVKQARAANPNITIFAGLSTNRAVSTPDMRHDFLIARGLVAGFWINIPHSELPRQRQIARQFLGRLPMVADASGRTCARPAQPRRPAAPSARPAVLGSGIRALPGHRVPGNPLGVAPPPAAAVPPPRDRSGTPSVRLGTPRVRLGTP